MAGQQEDKDLYDDVVIPAHIREALESSDNLDQYPTRWVFARNRDRGPIHPRSMRASMLRAADRRRGTTDSLKAINYGPVELAVRTWLAKLNWWR